eukprot:s2072_g16.t1
MGDVEYGKIYDFYLPPAFLRLYDGPSVNVEDMWRILGRGTTNGGLACYSFWQGGDFIKNDEPQGNQVFCQMNECIPEVVKAMRACVKETGSSKLFSANITADDPEEMIARGKYIMSQWNCSDLLQAQLPQADDEADGPYYRQEWQGMKETTPIISGGMNALRLPAFFENLGHSNGEEAWKQWKAGQFGNISLSDGVIEYAKTHEEIKGCILRLGQACLDVLS